MARYKVLEKTFHGIDLKEVGAEIEFDGKPGKNLEYVSGEKYKEPAAAPAPKSEREIELENEIIRLKAAVAAAQDEESAAEDALEEAKETASDDLA